MADDTEESTEDTILAQIEGIDDETEYSSDTDQVEDNASEKEAATPETQEGPHERSDSTRTDGKQQQETPGPQDLKDAQGNIIAKGGRERRFYEGLSKARGDMQQLSGTITALDAKVKAYEEANRSWQEKGLTAEDVPVAVTLLSSFRNDPVGTLQFLLTQAQAAGHNTDAIAGGGVDVGAIVQAIESKFQPILQTHKESKESQEREIRAQGVYDQFVTQFPDAPTHANEIAQLLEQDSRLTPGAAYWRLKAFFSEKGLDWSKPLSVHARERSTNGQGNTQRTSMPGSQGPTGGDVRATSEVADVDKPMDQIIRESMTEGGYNTGNI